jgi:hypothetical protein
MFRQLGARLTLVMGIGLAGVIVAADAASAGWSDGSCDPADQSCEIAVGTDPEPAPVPGGEVPGGSGGDAPAAVDPDAPVCESFTKESDADSHALAGERPSAEHQLLITNCTDPTTGTTIQQAQWVLPGEDGLPVDPAVLAQRAVDSLRLPQPQIASSPADFALVRLPVWLWLDGASWQEQSASASVPGLTVTAIATPVKATWSMGDGATVTCESAGTKWTTSYGAEDESPTCGHTYTRTSAGAPDGEFAVSVTVEWAVSWSGGGASGTEPGMTTTAQTSWPVAQSPALVK